MTLKPGDFLYAIDDGFKEPKVELARVETMTAKRIRLLGADGRESPGLGFDCRRSLSYEEAEQYGTTAHEAWVKYAARLTVEIDRAEQNLAHLRKKLTLAKARLQ